MLVTLVGKKTTVYEHIEMSLFSTYISVQVFKSFLICLYYFIITFFMPNHGQILSIYLHDIEQKQNSDISQGP